MKFRSCMLAATACLLVAPAASAEVSLGEVKGWEAFTTGRVNAFFTYITGDGSPIDAMGQPNTIKGGGLETTKDRIQAKDAAGMAIPGDQGSVSKMRLVSGYVPNVLTIGVRNNVAPDLKLKGVASIWGTIETKGQRKYELVQANFNEAYLDLSGSWGAVRAGKTLTLFSRGSYDLHYNYGYRYGVGNQFTLGPEAGQSYGMVGFGFPVATYSAGIYYSTPSLAGLTVALGLFDATQYDVTYDRTNTPRPELELAYDLDASGVKAHIFANGGFQKLYKQNNDKDSATLWGVALGASLEFGPIQVGGNYYTGKGVGLTHAFAQPPGHTGVLVGPAVMLNPITMAAVTPDELRSFDGFGALAGYATEVFDVRLGFGQSRAHQLEIDKVMPSPALIKTQTAISVGAVFHANKHLHPSIDYLRGMYRWYTAPAPTGEPKQDVNFINVGATIDW